MRCWPTGCLRVDEPVAEESAAEAPAPEAASPEPAPTEWWAYLLRSTRIRRTYVGIAVDVDRRLRQHNGELVGGARSTRSGRPWVVARRLGPFADRAEASRVEYAWKQVRGRQRLGWDPPVGEE